MNLQAVMGGAAVSEIPSAVDFKPYKIKSYLVKGKAGEKETITLYSRIQNALQKNDILLTDELITDAVQALPSTIERMDALLEKDNCKSRGEFIEEAIQFSADISRRRTA